MPTDRRSWCLAATVFLLVAVAVTAPFGPPTVAGWLGIGALGLAGWPVLTDMRGPAVVAVGHLGLVVSCFAAGVHDPHRAAWSVLLATFAALPLAWAARRRGRAVRAGAGTTLTVVTLGVFIWSTERLDDGPLAALPQFLLLPAVVGGVMLVRALRPPRPPVAPAPAEASPPPPPARPSWARDVT